MDRHFLIPVSIAAALHAGLLLGPGAPAKPAATPEKPREYFDAFAFLTPLDLTPPDPAPDEPASAAAASSAAPSLPELTTHPALEAFTIKVPESVPVAHTLPTSKLPLGPIGPESTGDHGLHSHRNPVLNLGDLENTPRTRTQSSPIYPFEAKRDGREGSVTVELMVDESGTVVSPHVVASTDRVFDDAALRAVAKWRFEPGRRDGRTVRFRMAVPIVFSLNAN